MIYRGFGGFLKDFCLALLHREFLQLEPPKSFGLCRDHIADLKRLDMVPDGSAEERIGEICQQHGLRKSVATQTTLW